MVIAALLNRTNRDDRSRQREEGREREGGREVTHVFARVGTLQFV